MSSFKDNFLPKKDYNTKFKDNRERFRLFNRFYKEPRIFTFIFLSVVAIILAIFPLPFPSFKSTSIGWILWSSGLFISIFFEGVANYHYFKYSKVANNKTARDVWKNVIYNKAIRYISMCGWVLIAFAIGVMAFSHDGSFASLW